MSEKIMCMLLTMFFTCLTIFSVSVNLDFMYGSCLLPWTLSIINAQNLTLFLCWIHHEITWGQIKGRKKSSHCTVASHNYNCCTDGSTSPRNYCYTLISWREPQPQTSNRPFTWTVLKFNMLIVHCCRFMPANLCIHNDEEQKLQNLCTWNKVIL
jgi:hypothetical protein